MDFDWPFFAFWNWIVSKNRAQNGQRRGWKLCSKWEQQERTCSSDSSLHFCASCAESDWGQTTACGNHIFKIITKNLLKFSNELIRFSDFILFCCSGRKIQEFSSWCAKTTNGRNAVEIVDEERIGDLNSYCLHCPPISMAIAMINGHSHRANVNNENL